MNGGTFVVPGGITPHLFYQYLAQNVKVWSDTTLILSDERLVDENSAKSNMGMIKKQLINQIVANTKPNLLPIVNDYTQMEAKQIVEKINDLVKAFLPPQAAFLGVGRDGHIASLFPDSKNNLIVEDPFIFVERIFESFQRVSLSATILTQTPHLFFLVSGKEKQQIVNRILNVSSNDTELPVQFIINNSVGDIILLCDQQAAA